jgi:transposase
MERIPRGIYTKELREEAVKLVTGGGLKIPEVGRRLSIAPPPYGTGLRQTGKASSRRLGKSRSRLPRLRWSLCVSSVNWQKPGWSETY